MARTDPRGDRLGEFKDLLPGVTFWGFRDGRWQLYRKIDADRAEHMRRLTHHDFEPDELIER